MNELLSILSAKPDITNAIAAISSAVIALVAFVVSVASLYVAHATLKHQRRHNVLSVTPIPHVSVADYENRTTVKIRNDGSGPMIVKNIHISDGSDTKAALVDWMPELPEGFYWATFVGEIADRSIAQGREVVLLELEGDQDDPRFVEVRDSVRNALAPLTVKIEYTDIYSSQLPPLEKALSWFGRHGQKAQTQLLDGA